jgi:thiol:disulfide interchange protein
MALSTLRSVAEASAILATVLLGGLALFQAGLAAGMPWGRLAWGGQHEVLPPSLRIGSAVSVVSYAVIAWVVWRAATEPEDDRPWMWVLTAFFGLGVAMNAASRSRPERLVMTPIVLVLALSCLLIALG